MNPILPLTTYLNEDLDFNESDIQAEIEALFQRQRLIQQMMIGRIDPSEVLDAINDSSLDVDEYIQCSIENIEYVIENQIPIEEL
jgi:hypothetical protein